MHLFVTGKMNDKAVDTSELSVVSLVMEIIYIYENLLTNIENYGHIYSNIGATKVRFSLSFQLPQNNLYILYARVLLFPRQQNFHISWFLKYRVELERHLTYI